MSPLICRFSFEISLTTSPLITVEFDHMGSFRLEDTTFLGMLFNLSAHSPLRDSQRVANPSSLRRPSSRATAPRASSVSTFAHASRSLPPNWPNQPPRVNPSWPSGSSTTPSSEMLVVMTIFPIAGLLFRRCGHRQGCRHADSEKLGADRPPTSPSDRCL